jgi:muramoyltetrapeptide carboxypeptidase
MTTRRRLIQGASLSAGAALVSPMRAVSRLATPSSRPMVKPRALVPGDTLGLVAPSSYVWDLWKLETIAMRLETALGVHCRFGKNVKARHGYMAGTERERIEDLHAMFADRSVAGIVAVEGGYGTERLVDRIDYDLIRRNPKVFLGYSDITGLHLAFNRRAGLVTFHGPVATSSLPAWTLANLKRALFDSAPIGELSNPPEEDPLSPQFPLHTIVAGRAVGPTAGGNLTLISTTMGTPYEIEAKGKILFLEDTGEAPYRIDRMLTQLKLAGKLAECAGIVWGTCTECTPARSTFEVNLSIPELLEEILGDLGKPALAGLVFGHTKEKSVLPLGVMAELDAGAKKVTVVEAATVR